MERRVLATDPNRDAACTAGIVTAVAPFARLGLAAFKTIDLPEGPPGIASWRDWFLAALPLRTAVLAALARTERFGISPSSRRAGPGSDAFSKRSDWRSGW